MLRFTLKQHRTQILLMLIPTILFIILAVTSSSGAAGYSNHLNYMRASIAVPALIGMFWGAPLVSREYEAGTHQLAWAQGVSRRRWLTTHLLALLIPAALYGIVLGITMLLGLGSNSVSRFAPIQFDITGLMPAVYSVFAVALGAACSAWRKRSIPAMAFTLLIFAGLNYGIASYLRPHYITLVSYTYAPVGKCVTVPLSPNGTRLVCPPPKQTPAYLASQQRGNWITKYASFGSNTMHYQPASRYVTFQLIETLLYVGLTTAALYLTYRLVLSHDA